MAAYELRPMALGELLDRGFTIYRRNFLMLTGISAVALVLPYLLMALGIFMGTESPGATFFFLVGGTLLMLVSYTYSIGAMTHAVSMILLGEPTGIGKSYGRVRGQALAVFGLMLLNGLGVLFGIMLLVVPGIIFSVRWAIGVPALVLEDLGPTDGLRRSWYLTAGFGGTVFLLALLQGAVSVVFSMLLQFPFTMLAAFSANDPDMVRVFTALGQVGGYLGNIVVFPIASTLWCLLYYDLRIRKEGFDLQQMMALLGTPGSAAPSRPVE